jgi:flavin reductase (DIM6/NTAB) family NADH-FMN oxidoreductase RutF
MVSVSETAKINPLAQIPGGLFILTASCEGRNGAALVKWVQQCSENPPMVMVGLPKGLPIELLIHSSQTFALCQISADDRYLIRKFSNLPDHCEDGLVAVQSIAPSGSPIVHGAMTCLDCQIVRHIELDSDFRIYVGQVTYSAVYNAGAPAICLGGNGLSTNK